MFADKTTGVWVRRKCREEFRTCLASSSLCFKPAFVLLIIGFVSELPVVSLFRMPPPEAAASGLQLCRQAQDQLQEAISSVSRTEQQLRENTREVSTTAGVTCSG